jgi:ParB family chromosome partitioning protein
MVAIDQVRVVNPRFRSKTSFRELVANIERVGLKKPITVSPRPGDEEGFDLVCGQGRLEAFIALGQKQIPALVVDLPPDEQLLRSLVENIARRNPATIEMVRDVEALKQRGYSNTEIAEKIGRSGSYIGGILRLLAKGESRLLHAVERGEIPVNVAIEIASTDEAAMQKSIAEAYEAGKLRGKALKRVRRVIARRKVDAKEKAARKTAAPASAPTSEQLVRTLKRESEKQRVLIKKAQLCETRLLFIAQAFAQLCQDESFVGALRAEKLDTLPKYLADRIAGALPLPIPSRSPSRWTPSWSLSRRSWPRARAEGTARPRRPSRPRCPRWASSRCRSSFR